MLLQFGQWNINGWHTITDKQLGLLECEDCDWIAMQEVTESSYEVLVKSGLFHHSELSLRLRPAKDDEGKGRRLGCAIFCSKRFSITSSQLLEDAPLPERTLMASVSGEENDFTVCSFHAPSGVNWGEIKPQTFRTISNWLTQYKTRTLFGMDANAPKTDHPTHAQNEWWWDDEARLLGSETQHNLRDIYRTYLHTDSQLSEAITSARPNGPLAISYQRGRGENLVPCRYDFIYATPDFVVKKVRYLYDEAVNAGSDHALVVADLEFNTD